MHRIRDALTCASIVAAVLALAGCANRPVQYYAYAAPAGYHYSETFGYIQGDYLPDGVYVGPPANKGMR